MISASSDDVFRALPTLQGEESSNGASLHTLLTGTIKKTFDAIQANRTSRNDASVRKSECYDIGYLEYKLFSVAAAHSTHPFDKNTTNAHLADIKELFVKNPNLAKLAIYNKAFDTSQKETIETCLKLANGAVITDGDIESLTKFSEARREYPDPNPALELEKAAIQKEESSLGTQNTFLQKQMGSLEKIYRTCALQEQNGQHLTNTASADLLTQISQVSSAVDLFAQKGEAKSAQVSLADIEKIFGNRNDRY
jgi:hypothetical protein